MIQFQYVRTSTPKAAVDAVSKTQNARFIAGGTNLVDLMKRNIMTPEKLVDINNIPLKGIEQQGNKIVIGALALNSQVADSKLVQEKLPLLSQSLNAGASAQIRNMATVGGNMMQRTRCNYFYDTAMPCNKREPGLGCGALEGFNRMHAIFGTSEKCIAVHPSDMCIALVALDATVVAAGPKGERRIPFAEFHRLPGDTPEKDNNLMENELITAIEIPDNAFTRNVHYLKIRDRASYAFAVISVAAALHIENNTIKDARLAMGGVSHKPWRLSEAEKALIGKPASEKTFRNAAEIAMQGAKAYKHNAFKLKLGPNTIVQALKNAAEPV
ncbi:FAD binding domain-containing protein [Dyadobacter sediminis]|uniref:Xanthine dehydrogenase family protein subunit M n=1 Tax=Dyadobacter sediminis TaxID=1493691 RepID=A0A5R9KC03_9BACT|nr:xanthine dehydrogenase family protein subunit M [Dyadobacter sediminis]TLU92360.1 xanthine dehydrogenase family protein subunit M [Dyadobacter sediminis]GGB95067.1 oxidoreductase [Dyadobacter sediminis]